VVGIAPHALNLTFEALAYIPSGAVVMKNTMRDVGGTTTASAGRVDQREDGCIGADADGQGQNGDNGQPRISPKRPKGDRIS